MGIGARRMDQQTQSRRRGPVRNAASWRSGITVFVQCVFHRGSDDDVQLYVFVV